MLAQAKGQFEVKLQLQEASTGIEAARLGRQTINKQFQGDLQASSLGEMLAVMTEVKGSAAYVALERVDGTLHGKRGSFVLLHSAVMDRGAPTLNVQVVADSGSGELSGLRGSMRIEISEGQHSYVFDYSLPAD